MDHQHKIQEIKKKNIKISNILKDISKDINYLSSDLITFPVSNTNSNNIVQPAGHTAPIINSSHLHFTNTLRSFW
tara:strand:- start:2187 stop:2411 length:225 start_codon:yes stop_codon:yes gene_type:complete